VAGHNWPAGRYLPTPASFDLKLRFLRRTNIKQCSTLVLAQVCDPIISKCTSCWQLLTVSPSFKCHTICSRHLLGKHSSKSVMLNLWVIKHEVGHGSNLMGHWKLHDELRRHEANLSACREVRCCLHFCSFNQMVKLLIIFQARLADCRGVVEWERSYRTFLH